MWVGPSQAVVTPSKYQQLLHFDCLGTSVCPKGTTIKSPDRTKTQACAIDDATVRQLSGVEGGKVCHGYHQPEVDPRLNYRGLMLLS